MKKTKSCLFLLIAGFMLMTTGCASKKELEGNWETTALIKEGVYQQIMISNIKFVFEDKEIRIKGDAGVNLYNANVKVKGKSLKVSKMENTGFQGLADEMEYEDLFFRVLMNSDSWKIDGDLLYLYAPSEKMEIQLKKK